MPKALAAPIIYKNNGNSYLITANHVFKNYDYKKLESWNDPSNLLNHFMIH